MTAHILYMTGQISVRRPTVCKVIKDYLVLRKLLFRFNLNTQPFSMTMQANKTLVEGAPSTTLPTPSKTSWQWNKKSKAQSKSQKRITSGRSSPLSRGSWTAGSTGSTGSRRSRGQARVGGAGLFAAGYKGTSVVECYLFLTGALVNIRVNSKTCQTQGDGGSLPPPRAIKACWTSMVYPWPRAE